jgi:hypothetical protein
MIKQTKEQKAADKRIERVYQAACSGIAINLMDIPKVFRAGREVLAADPNISDEGLGKLVRAYVETIRIAA